MGEGRKITIQQNAVSKIAEAAWYIESNFSSVYAKKFIDDVFSSFDKLARPEVSYAQCSFKPWNDLGYKCYTFRKKYSIAYLEFSDEVVICDFGQQALLK